ncbi:hypothetical protein [Rhodococcoides corynebacterioides]|uniref:Uncharacterized protein n=1 Tax=Rhodococcoides corynebacterioides TaxID=53972 RepID=A0ABS7P1Y9_9NOCA|nr:hypothetical protein [Rhodococcus corynebacterioides]MBY6350617.1 hypothetical protein [Rhodococcus corynebacterioides]MBY6366071.1 hypothetical protein [Rhodococcus corynebacterioides]MBY6406971.1 hypothetical protein [Rhodococcus corynebacterioides]
MRLSPAVLSSLGAAGGAALVAVWALSNARPIDLYQAETDTRSPYVFGNNWSDRFLNSSWAVGIALVVVVVALWVGGKYRLAPALGAGAGLFILGAPSVVDVPTGLAPTTTGLAAGLLLGFAVSTARSDRAVAVAVIVGAACAYPVRRDLDARFGSPRDWSISLGGSYATTLVPIVVLVLVLALVVCAVATTTGSTAPMAAGGSGSTMVAIAAVVTWAVYVSFGDSASSTVQWVTAVAVTVAVVGVVAVRCGRDGGFVCAGLAVAATTINGMTWSGWWLAPLALVGIAVGFLLARRVPSTVVGCCVLAVVCASGLMWDNAASTVAYAAVLPTAAAYSYASSLVSDPSVLALGVLLPVICAVFGFSALGKRPSGVFGWVPNDQPIEIPAPGSVVPATATAIAAAVAASLVAAVLATRTRRQPSTAP